MTPAEVLEKRDKHAEAHLDCCGGKGYCRECYEKWPCDAILALLTDS